MRRLQPFAHRFHWLTPPSFVGFAEQCHCPVIGVCFPLARLRQLVHKALGNPPVADDYDIHLGAVAECAKRSRLTELLHKDVEARFTPHIRASSAGQRGQSRRPAVGAGGAFGRCFCSIWAALTHPRCDEALQEVLLRDMHMLQHQAGAAVRVDLHQFQALSKENAVLTQELGKVQSVARG